MVILSVHLNFHLLCNLCSTLVSKFNNEDINMHIYNHSQEDNLDHWKLRLSLHNCWEVGPVLQAQAQEGDCLPSTPSLPQGLSELIPGWSILYLTNFIQGIWFLLRKFQWKHLRQDFQLQRKVIRAFLPRSVLPQTASSLQFWRLTTSAANTCPDDCCGASRERSSQQVYQSN